MPEPRLTEAEIAAMLVDDFKWSDHDALVRRLDETRRALRQVREERENRERYWDGVRRLMVEAGAEPGDAEHLARSLIDQLQDALLALGTW